METIEQLEFQVQINCKLIKNENGVFLVFDSNLAAETAADLFVGWEACASYGQYDNALRLKSTSR